MNMQRWSLRLRWSLSLAAILLFAHAASAAVVNTEMSVLPHADLPAWTAAGQTSIASIDAGILRVNDVNGDFLQYSQNLGTQNKTLEARVRVNQSTPDTTGIAAYMGLVNNGTWGVFLNLQPDKISLVERVASFSLLDTYATDLQTDFRTIRMTQDLNTTRVYLDELEIFSHQQAQFSTAVSFGALTINSKSDSYWDYVSFTGDGAFDPEQLDFGAGGNGDEGNGGGDFRASAASNPEPSTAVLLLLGATLAASKRRRNRR